MPDNNDTFKVSAPVSGDIVALSNVPDPVFAEKMLGDGLAINPTENILYAPFDGTISTLHKALHALVIEKNHIAVLLHIGVETVNLKGQGFKAFVKQGQEVKKGDKLIEFDRDFIAASVPSSYVIAIVTDNPHVVVEKTTAPKVKAGDFFFNITGEKKTLIVEESNPSDVLLSETITIKNKNGLHARPAAAIAAIAGNYKNNNIEIIKGSLKANAKSMVEILGMSLEYNDKIQISATGDKKEDIIKELSEAIKRGLNESVAQISAENTGQTQKEKIDFTGEVRLKVSSIFPDIVIGKAYKLRRQEISVEETSSSNADAELGRLTNALHNIETAINTELEAVKKQKNRSEILKAHLSILADPFLLKTAKELLKEGKTAAFAWQGAIKKSIDILNSTGNKLLVERVSDYQDIKTRVLFDLAGIEQKPPTFPEDSIIIAEDLLAHELNFLNQNVKGIVLSDGSPTSHVAIMLKNMSLASAIAPKNILDIAESANIILNSEKGYMLVNPSEIEEIKKQQAKRAARRQENLAHAFEPAATIDGVKITVQGNIGSLSDAKKAAEHGSEGIGLVRTEFLFADAAAAPKEDEQYELYKAIAGTQSGKTITVRTLDVGGDKTLEYLAIPPEANPIMGLRGVRNYNLNMDIFKAQARAIMRVKPNGVAKIMLPMVAFASEFKKFKDIILQEQENLGVKNVSVGIMVEVPSAALMAGELARYVDFFSIGTNDLTQYALAIDRGHKELSPYADSLHPAVLKLIEATVKGAAKFNKPVGVCGAMASDMESIPILLGLGIRDLSVVSSLIPDIKAFIRSLDWKKCAAKARLALAMEEASQVREMIKTEFKI